MKNLKKAVAIVLTFAIAMSMGIAMTVAYFTDTEEEVNVMTVGNVNVELIELQRDENGGLEPFEDNKALTPIVGSAQGGKDKWGMPEIKNYVDKIVYAKNIGAEEAYMRILVAIPAVLEDTVASGASGNALHWNFGNRLDKEGASTWNSGDWQVAGNPFFDEFGANVTYTEPGVDIDGVEYNVYEFLSTKPYKKGEETAAPIVGFYLDEKVDYDDETEKYYMGDVEINYDFSKGVNIPVILQAVQADGFADAAAAFTAAFPEDIGTYFEDMKLPTNTEWEGVSYLIKDDEAKVMSETGDTVYRGILSDGKTTVSEVVISEGIVRLNNRALCKAPTIKTVSLPDSLTYIDESVFQQSGITSIEIPENVTYIGKQAFGACDNLETITINAKDVTIANYVARACANLKEVYFYSDSVTFETGSMYFTNKENGDASGITFYVKDQAMADTLYSAFSTSHSYGLLIKSLDGVTEYYNTL